MLLLVWFLISTFIIFAADLLSFAVKRNGWSRFISTFILFYAQILFTEFLLGYTNILFSLSLIIFNLIISSLLVLFIIKNNNIGIIPHYFKSFKKSFNNFVNEIKKDYLFLILLLIGIMFIFWVIFIGIIFPAIDFDGNSYHLTFIGYAIQNHNIYDVQSSLPWLMGYPKGGELIAAWNVIIPNSDIIVDLFQIPFLILGIVSLYEICIAFGATRANARFVALMYIFIPVVLNQLKTTYVDVILCSLFFASLAMLINKKQNTYNLLILGFIFALTLSLKFTGVLFLIAAMPFLFISLYQTNNKKIKNSYKKYFKQLLILVLPILFGLFWYIKNFILYGSPLYPFGLKILGFSIFPGKTFQEFASSAIASQSNLPNGVFQRAWYVWTEQKDWFGCFYNYDANYTGLGPVWFIILIPAIIVSVILAIKHKNYMFNTLILVTFIIFIIYPSNYYSRYTLFIVGTGIVSLSIVFMYLRKRAIQFVKVIIIALSIIVVATNFVLCNYPPIAIENQIKVLRKGEDRDGQSYEGTIGSAYVFIQNIIKTNETVAYDSSPYFIYALWNNEYSNNVTYIKSDNKDEWISNILNKGVDYVFTNTSSKEHDWASMSNLNSIYKDEMYEIYKVN